MDILSHGLWGAIGAKALNRALAVRRKELRLNPWWTGFWGAFPDLLAFTPLVLFIVWNVTVGDATFTNFRTAVPDAYLNPIQYALRNLTGVLYPLSHSMVTWVVAFLAVWLLLRRPAWELLGWFSHIVLDIGTHPTEFYPTQFLWPVSDFSVGGISWATPTFLVINYALLFALLFFLRERRTLKESFRAMTRVRKIFLGALVIIAVLGAWSTFQRRAGEALPHEPVPTVESR
ncbi:MAG: hypothetical protein Q8P88_03270 [Candidatus Jorgensenbacteria bacterium]|nr:hypothetical protein [Candidatus Jorgensenbacteria bacterium]